MVLSLCWTNTPPLFGIMWRGFMCPTPPPPQATRPLPLLKSPQAYSTSSLQRDGPEWTKPRRFECNQSIVSGCLTMCVIIPIYFILVLFSCGTLLQCLHYFVLIIIIFSRLINHSTDKEFRVHSSDHLGCSCKQPSFITVHFLALSQRV